MRYWSIFEYNEQRYTVVTTDRGLCFLGNDFETNEAFLQWAQKKKWDDLLQSEEQVAPFIEQIKYYMCGERMDFTVVLDLQGTAFQQQVWHALQLIPYGQTVSYSDIAEQIGNKKAVRAVASAIGANPVMVVIPCHRVIGKNGKLTGFRGGLELKRLLLELEGNHA